MVIETGVELKRDPLGVEEQIAEYAGHQISDTNFEQERNLSNGWRVNSKEELYYYRVFREHFGDLEET